MGLLGERLRLEREKQGITLDEVCASTKINTRMLRAIEEEKFDQLPGGIFNKGFVRAYARHLNIDEQQAVDDYLIAAGLVVVAEPLATAVAEVPPVQIPKTDLPKIEVKPIAEPKREESIHRNGKGKHAKAQASKPELAEPAPQKKTQPAQIKPSQIKPAQIKKEAKSVAKPAKRPPARVENETPLPGLSPAERIPWGRLAFALLLIAFGFAIWGSFARESEQQSPRPVATPASKPLTGDSKTLQNVSVASPEVTIPPAPAPADTAQVASSLTSQPALPVAAASTDSASETASFKVVVQAREDSWVSITADGKEVMSQVLGAPAEKAVEAHKEVVIKVGNAGGVDFLFNGKKVPSQGEPDQVKVLTFDPNGLETPVSKAPTTLASRPAA